MGVPGTPGLPFRKRSLSSRREAVSPSSPLTRCGQSREGMSSCVDVLGCPWEEGAS